MSLRSCAAAIAIVFLSCSKAPEKVAPSAPPVASTPTASVPVAHVDSHREACDAAIALIREWSGDRKKLEQAREKLMAILAQDKNYAPAYAGLARVEYEGGYIRGNEFDSTALNRGWKLVQHALKLDPGLFDAHLTAGWISRYMGELDSARASLDRAEELRPGTTLVKMARAEIADAENDPLETLRLAKEVIAQSDNAREKASAYGYLIDVYGEGGHADQVDEAYREQLKLQPGSAWNHGNYAEFLLRRGQTDAAIREAETAVGILPYPLGVRVLVRALLTRAEAQWNANQVQESGKTIERIVALAGEEPEICARMGAFYEGAAIRGKDASLRKKALAWYQKALAKMPENRDVQRAVARLQS